MLSNSINMLKMLQIVEDRDFLHFFLETHMV